MESRQRPLENDSYLGEKARLANSMSSNDEDTKLANRLGLARERRPTGLPACSLVIVSSLCQLEGKPNETSLVIREDHRRHYVCSKKKSVTSGIRRKDGRSKVRAPESP